jgi:hypothetical protein
MVIGFDNEELPRARLREDDALQYREQSDRRLRIREGEAVENLFQLEDTSESSGLIE